MNKVEVLRFFRSDKRSTFVTTLILAFGIALVTMSIGALISLDAPSSPGMSGSGYVTVGARSGGGDVKPTDWTVFERIRDEDTGTALLAAYSEPTHLTGDVSGTKSEIAVSMVSLNFFDEFTNGLTAGQNFNPSSESLPLARVLIVSLAFAQRNFGSAGSALNRQVLLNGQQYRVVAVTKPEFTGLFGFATDAWAPATNVDPLVLDLSSRHREALPAWKTVASFYVVGATRPRLLGASTLLGTLQREIASGPLAAESLTATRGLTITPVYDLRLRRWFRLSAVLAFVFIVAAAFNHSAVLLSRVPGKIEEISLKRSFGAHTSQLVAELTIPPLLMVLCSCVCAAIMTAITLHIVRTTMSFGLSGVAVSERAMWYCASILGVLMVVLTAIIAAVPAARLLSVSARPNLGYTLTVDTKTGRALQAVVAIQIAACVSAFVFVGMILTAVRVSMSEWPGFNSRNLIATRIATSREVRQISISINSDGQFPLASVLQSLVDSVSSLPGAASVAVATSAPLDQPIRTIKLQAGIDRPFSVSYVAASQNYFETLGAVITLGRGFSTAGFTGVANEFVVNQALVSRLREPQHVLGSTLKLTNPATGIVIEGVVVGVVRNMRYGGVASAADPTIYIPLRGLVFTMGMPFYVIARDGGSLTALAGQVASELKANMPGLEMREAFDVDARARADARLDQRRALLSVLGTICVAIVAFFGLYSSLMFYVSSRVRELAVRVCYGATQVDIIKIIALQASGCCVIGVLLSAFTWPILAKSTQADWFGRTAWSSWLPVESALLCVGLALMISIWPARQFIKQPLSRFLHHS